MPEILAGFREDEPHQPELAICITAPEEFIGVSIAELNSRRGCITRMDNEPGKCLIRATLPESEYGALARRIAVTTQNRAKIELDTMDPQAQS